MGVILRRFAYCCIAAILTVAASYVAVWVSRIHHEEHGDDWRRSMRTVDFIIVLGGSGWTDECGYKPEMRLGLGLDVLAAHPEAVLVYSHDFGGDPVFAQAFAARSAIDLGHELPDDIIIETRAVSTFENVWRSIEAAGIPRDARVMIVTDHVHAARARMLWWAFTGTWPSAALTEVYRRSAPAHWYHDYALREAAAWWLNGVKMVGWKALGLTGMTREERAEFIR